MRPGRGGCLCCAIGNSYIRHVYLRRKRADHGKIPRGRGQEPREEDMHELQREKRRSGDSMQEVRLQRSQTKDQRNQESLNKSSHSGHLSIQSQLVKSDASVAVEKRGGGDSTAVGHHPWLHLSSSFKRACCQFGKPGLQFHIITLILLSPF